MQDYSDYSEYGGRSGGGNNQSKAATEDGREDVDLQEEHRHRANWLAKYSAQDSNHTNAMDQASIPPDIHMQDDLVNQTEVQPWLREREEFIRHATTTDITKGGYGTFMLKDDGDGHNQNGKYMQQDTIKGLTEGILDTLAKHLEAEARKGLSCPVLKWGGLFGQTVTVL